MPYTSRSDARRYDCPACGVLAGHKCVGARGKVRESVHLERLERAARAENHPNIERLTVDEQGCLVGDDGRVVGKLMGMEIAIQTEEWGNLRRGVEASRSVVGPDVDVPTPNAQTSAGTDGDGERLFDAPDQVAELFELYRTSVPGRERSQLTTNTRKLIRKALDERPFEQCKLAVIALSRSPHHLDGGWTHIRYALGKVKQTETVGERIDMMAAKAGGGTNALPTVEELLRTVPSGGAEIVRLRMERARAFIEMSDEQKQRAQQGDERAVGIVQDGNEALRLLREAPPRVEAVIDGGRLKGWRRV